MSLEEWGIDSPERYKCDCGFEGNTRTFKWRDQTFTQCSGCDKLKVWDGEFFVDASMPEDMTAKEMTDFLAFIRLPEPAAPKSKSVANKKVPQKLTANDAVYVAMHFYTRTNDSYRKVLNDAREELRLRPETTVIFAHDHQFGAKCDDKCKRKVTVRDNT